MVRIAFDNQMSKPYCIKHDYIVIFKYSNSFGGINYKPTLLEEKVLYRTLKGSISTTYLEPLKGSIHS